MYTDVKQIGQGSFGTVTLVKDSHGKFFARKHISDIIDILVGVRETDVLKRIEGTHPYLINICDYTLRVEESKYSIDQYLEYCSGGSLEELLDAEFKNPDRPIDPILGGVRNRLLGLRNIIESMVLLQNMGVYHMDMKTENILYRRRVDNAYDMCLCDFSNYVLDTLWKTNMEAPLVPQEAIMYRAPEIGLLRNTWEAHRKADVWALGVILMEIAGGWKTVQEIDSEVSVRTERIINLVDKIKILQTNYIKRNGKRKNFKLPAKILLSDRILREELGREFGKEMSDETSLENQLLCSVFYAKQLCSPEILKRACEDSLEHFHVRKDTGDQELIRSLYETILPKIFVTDVEKRISLQELYTVLSDMLSKNTIPTPEPFTGIADGGIWERIPDKIWRETVLEFHSCTSGCEISYGRKTIPIPINHLLFSKRISEAALEKLIAGVDDILSKDVSSRRKFYENVLTASSFIASELLDFILPYDQCTWFERHTLEDTAPFIKLVGDLLMGEICQLLPNTGEMDCLTGTSSL